MSAAHIPWLTDLALRLPASLASVLSAALSLALAVAAPVPWATTDPPPTLGPLPATDTAPALVAPPAPVARSTPSPIAPLAQETAPVILPLRERAALLDARLTRRLDTLVPTLMRRHAIDLWIVAGRETNEDPVLSTMLPATWLAARRRTVLVFHDRGEPDGVERFAVSRYPVGDAFAAAWDPDTQPDGWARLAELVAERDPARIGINTSETFGHADGLSHTEALALTAALTATLGDDGAARLVSAEGLAVDWLQTRVPEEIETYEQLVALTHAVIAEAFSPAVITPGQTTTDDVVWWFRERVAELHLDTWFHPDVSVQRAGDAAHDGSFAEEEGVTTIQPGDLLHCDFGITYLGLCSDIQQHAYVLRVHETAAPQGLVDALATGNRLQGILVSQFQEGRTGNAVLARALGAAREAGLKPMIYTHPLGVHGHGAGATIGLWDRQDGVPGPGDVALRYDTVWAIELNAEVTVPEWDDRPVRIMLEEDALFERSGVRFLDGRLQSLHLIPARSER